MKLVARWRRGASGSRDPRGQGLVEFALTLPLLLVFLLGVADFARVFTAGITMEAAARNGAEAAAQEYLQRSHKSGGLVASDYADLHDIALAAVCAETETLPNQVKSGGSCTMPLAAVCIHDGVDPGCGIEADPAFANCPEVNGAWNNANSGPAQGTPPRALPYVEVRACYKFTTLMNISNLNLPFGWSLTLGDVWLQRDREFTVADY
jgi:TadE-like protein